MCNAALPCHGNKSHQGYLSQQSMVVPSRFPSFMKVKETSLIRGHGGQMNLRRQVFLFLRQRGLERLKGQTGLGDSAGTVQSVSKLSSSLS